MKEVEVSLKALRVTGDRYIGKSVRLSNVTFIGADPEVFKSAPVLRLVLRDDSGSFFNTIADREQFADRVLELSRGDRVEILGHVDKLEEDGDDEVVLIVSRIKSSGSDEKIDVDDMDVAETSGDSNLDGPLTFQVVGTSDDSNDDEEDGDDEEDEDEDEDDSDPPLAAKEGALDVTNRIERLEPFEERLGVRLAGLSAFFEDGDVTVRGELQPRKGHELAQMWSWCLRYMTQTRASSAPRRTRCVPRISSASRRSNLQRHFQ